MREKRKGIKAVRTTRKPQTLSNLEAILPPNASLALLFPAESAETSLCNSIAGRDQFTDRSKYKAGSSCSIREDNISKQSILHHTKLSLLKEIGISCSSVVLGRDNEKVIKSSNYRKSKARMNEFIDQHKQEYGRQESLLDKPVLCVTELGGLELLDMTVNVANATK